MAFSTDGEPPCSSRAAARSIAAEPSANDTI